MYPPQEEGVAVSKSLCYNQSMIEFLNDTPIGRAVQSYVKTFVAVVLALFLADGADIFSVSTDDLRVWLAAGLAAVLPLIVTALNPADTRFGQNAETPEDLLEDVTVFDNVPEEEPEDA